MLRQNLYGLLWALFILILCGIPGQDIPHISFLELLSFDKLVHASIFFILVILLYKGFKVSSQVPLLFTYSLAISVIVSIIYGGLLEIMQGLVFENRSADFFDFIANSFGAMMAAIYLRKKIGRQKI